MKITTQSREDCSRCNQMILEKSVAYRDEKYDLVCVDCYEVNIPRKKDKGISRVIKSGNLKKITPKMMLGSIKPSAAFSK